MTGLNPYHYFPEQEVRDSLPCATYFILEAFTEFGDHNLLAAIEDADDEGSFAVHVGLPGRPAQRHALRCTSFVDGVAALAALRVSHPGAGLWLSTQEMLVEIKGTDPWRGVVEARASLDPGDHWCNWNCLAAALAEKVAPDAPVTVDLDAHPAIIALAERL